MAQTVHTKYIYKGVQTVYPAPQHARMDTTSQTKITCGTRYNQFSTFPANDYQARLEKLTQQTGPLS